KQPQSEHNGALPRGRFPPCRRRRPTPPPLIPTRPPTPTPAGPATPPPQSPSPARGNLCTGTCTTCSTAAREAQRATPAMDGTPPPKPEAKLAAGEAGYVLEDVPHVSDYLPDLPTYPNPLQDNTAYSVVKQYFVDPDDTVCQKIVVHKDGPRGNHFRRAGPRQRVYHTLFMLHIDDKEKEFSLTSFFVSIRSILNLTRSMLALSPVEDSAQDLILLLGKLYAAYLTCTVSPRYLGFRVGIEVSTLATPST
uniref:Uncharacterized protein n=2 Tax=Aegilops tauschii subsp. strangulata TaxID=200361 RepID=A0A453QPQ0_AEGTS